MTLHSSLAPSAAATAPYTLSVELALPTTPDTHVVHVSLQPDGAFGLAPDGVVHALMLSTDASPSDVLEVRGRSSPHI